MISIDSEYWKLGNSGGKRSDLNPCLYAGYAALDLRLFRNHKSGDLVKCKDREELLEALRPGLCKLRESRTYVVAQEIRKVFGFAEEQGLTVSRGNIVAILEKYSDHVSSESSASALRSVVKIVLEAFPTVSSEKLWSPSIGTWCLGHNGRHPCDLTQCLYLGFANMATRSFRTLSPAELQVSPKRESLLRALIPELSKLKPAWQYGVAAELKRIFRFSEARSLTFDIDNTAPALRAYFDEGQADRSLARFRKLVRIFLEVLCLNEPDRRALLAMTEADKTFKDRDERWRVGKSAGGHACDLSPCLYVGCASMDLRAFRKLRHEELPPHESRLALLEQLRPEILKLRSGQQYSAAQEIKRFIRYVESNVLPIAPKTDAVRALSTYACDPANAHREPHTRALIRIFIAGLKLSPSDGPTLYDRLANNDGRGTGPKPKHEWAYAVGNNEGKRRVDFRRLLLPGDANLKWSAWSKLDEERKNQGFDKLPARTKFVDALRMEWAAQLTSEAWRPTTLTVAFDALRAAFHWTDSQGLPLSHATAVKSLALYSRYLDNQLREANISPAVARRRLDQLIPLFSWVLKMQTYELRAKLVGIRSQAESGLTTEYVSPDQIREFCGFLNGLINRLSADFIESEIVGRTRKECGPFGVELKAQHPAYANTQVPFALRNRHLIRLRVYAEYLRFCALTGANKQPALDLTIDDWDNSTQERATVYKIRAGHDVVLVVPRQYVRLLNQHVEFVRRVHSNWSQSDLPTSTPLFPNLWLPPGSHDAHAASHRTGLLDPAWRKLDRGTLWLDFVRHNNVPTIPVRQLRRAKAQWLLRRYRGDSLATSQALGNEPQTTFRHYGGKGNLVVAIRELAEFWVAEPTLQFSRAPGFCESPGQYSAAQDSNEPGSCNDATACLRCRNYRGEESIDYVHRILTLAHSLQVRARVTESAQQAIQIADQIVQEFVTRRPEAAGAVNALRRQIASGQSWHQRYAPMMTIARLNVARSQA